MCTEAVSQSLVPKNLVLPSPHMKHVYFKIHIALKFNMKDYSEIRTYDLNVKKTIVCENLSVDLFSVQQSSQK